MSPGGYTLTLVMFFMVGFVITLLLLAVRDQEKYGNTPMPPVERSLWRVPSTAVSEERFIGHFQDAEQLVRQLAHSDRAWVESRNEADDWLAESIRIQSADKRLKRAYLILLGVELGCKSDLGTTKLSTEYVESVKQWLDEYLGHSGERVGAKNRKTFRPIRLLAATMVGLLFAVVAILIGTIS